MRIAITGSWREEDRESWKLRDKAGFFTAVASVTAELVRLGHRLVVATDSRHTADRAAVDGALSALPREGVYDQPVVDLLRGDHMAFEDLQRRRPGFFNLQLSPSSSEVTKLYQVHLADVVLAVGGADKTLQAAIAAAASGKRIVPVGAFGGAAARAVEIFEAMAGSWGLHIPPSDALGPLAAAWAPQSAELVIRALRVRHPKLLVIHGRDHVSRDSLVGLLKQLGLPDPIVLANEPNSGKALPDKFELYAKGVDAAIALVTPDDVGGLREAEVARYRARARQNVWVEFGWFWGARGLPRVLLLGKNHEDIDSPSDLSGLIVAEFTDSPVEREDKICQWIEDLGWPKPRR